jgi:hybrid cluster-associated redox disulfide protein
MIKKDMNIKKSIEKYPIVANMLEEEGIRCARCAASEYETIELGLKGHGKTDAEIDKIIEDINKSL